MLGTTNNEAMANGNPELMRRPLERVVMTLEHEPQTVWTSEDRPMLAFTGRVGGGATPLTVFLPKAPEEEVSPEAERALREIGGGDTVTLTGRWQYQDWPDVEGRPVATRSFFAEEFVRGDIPQPSLRTLEMPTIKAPEGPSALVGGMGAVESDAFAHALTRMDSRELQALATEDLVAQRSDDRDERLAARIDLCWREFERRSELHLYQRAENEALRRSGGEVSPRHLAAAESEAAYRSSLSPKFQALMRDQWAKTDRWAQGM